MKLTEYIKENIVYLDGGLGTMLQMAGLPAGELPEHWNMTQAARVTDIHRQYFDAGSNIVCANTFGANSLKFEPEELEQNIRAAIENVRLARETSKGKQEKYIALDIGSTGKLLKPYGDLDFEEAVRIFAKTIQIGAKCGADLIFIETMNDIYETKAALLAAKENCDLPVFVSNAYGEDGKLMTGAEPAAVIAMLEGMHADAIGVNCSLGPKALQPVIEEYLKYASVPVLVKPNAGLPKLENGRTFFDVGAEEFASDLAAAVKRGVRMVGGCCGTTPEYIRILKEKTADCSPRPAAEKNRTVVSSYTHAVAFEQEPVLIGERINPTGKKRLKQALLEQDISYVLEQGFAQKEAGAHILDVNVGLPELNEAEVLPDIVCELQAVLDLPLQIDTSNPAAMEAAVRRYNGKPMINSVNGKAESMEAIFPIVKKYGGLVVALTLDETGIPETVEGRLKIAEKIIQTAAEYEIQKKNLIFDPLAMTISAAPQAAEVALGTLRELTKRGCHTSLGVSNISFGLPNRDIINSSFFALTLENGLSAAIMNPGSAEMMKTYYAYRALKGMDTNCAAYIAFAATVSAAQNTNTAAPQNTALPQTADKAGETALQTAIRQGLKEQVRSLTTGLLCTIPPLEIIQNEIIPALDRVGKGFEEKTVYLPQLLISAEAAKTAFEVIKEAFPKSKAEKCCVVLATVQGDIHDIGKNIVHLLLENYGFEVIDLGRDVAPELVVQAVVTHHAPVAGLSALMTTTVPAMEETIRQLHAAAPFCKIVVGGAVLTKEYAEKIGADKYSGDAMETVRYADRIYSMEQSPVK